MLAIAAIAAFAAFAAFAVPLVGAGVGACDRAGSHAGMMMDSPLQTAEMGSAESGHCDACDAEAPESQAPGEHGDAAQCASMSSCTFSSAMILQSRTAAPHSTLGFARFDVDSRHFGERASPEPPPPRAWPPPA